jgi:hypothetical protein
VEGRSRCLATRLFTVIVPISGMGIEVNGRKELMLTPSFNEGAPAVFVHCRKG